MVGNRKERTIAVGCSRMGAEEDNNEGGRPCVTRSCMALTKCYPGDHIEGDEMGGACGTLGEGRNACMVIMAVTIVM